MGPNGSLKVLMRPYGISWVLKCPFKFLCTFMGTHGSKWVRMRPCGSLWVIINPYVFLWALMGPYASLLFLIGPYPFL